MAYGDQINVGNLKTDYSGLERAGQYKGQGLASIGQGLATGIDKINDFFKEQSEKKKVVKQAETYINAAMTLFPEMSAHLTEVSNVIKNEDLPLSDRYAQAEGIQNLLSMGFESMKISAEKEQAKREFDIKKAQIDAESMPKYPDSADFGDGKGGKIKGFRRTDNTYVDLQGNVLGKIDDSIGNEYDETLLPLPNNLMTEADNIGAAVTMVDGVNIDGGYGVLPDRVGYTPPSAGAGAGNYSDPYTDEYGNIVQKNLDTGKISRVASPPSGGIEIDTKTGRVIVGGSAGRGQQVAENAEALKTQTAELGVIAISDAVNELDRMLQGGDAVSTLGRVVGSKLPMGSPSRNFTIKSQALKDRIALGSLTELRSASPTGGALGQVSNAEGQRLENKFGLLSAEQTPEDNKRTLRDIAITYAEIIHGTDKELDKALKEGKLTADQVAQGKVMRASMIQRAMSGKVKGLEDARAAGDPQPQAPTSLADPAAESVIEFWQNRVGNQ